MTPAAPDPLFTAHRIAAITGLTRAAIYQAAEHGQLGSPAHFVFRAEILYTLKGLCQLVEALDQLGHGVGARALAAVVAQHRQRAATAAGVTSPDDARELARRWDLRAEAAAETTTAEEDAA